MFEFFPLNVSALESLNIYDLKLWREHLLASLVKCTKLKKLVLDEEAFDFFTLLVPNICTSLESIELGECASDEIISIIANECINLTELIVDYERYVGYKRVSLDGVTDFFNETRTMIETFGIPNVFKQ